MRFWIVLLLVALAGCLDSTENSQESLGSADALRFSAIGSLKPVEIGVPERVDLDCTGRCVLPVVVPRLPDQAYLEVLVAWDGTKTTLESDLAGAVRGFDSMRWLLEEPGPVDILLAADGALSVRVRVLGLGVDFLSGDEMLPNIVTYAPVQIAFGECDRVERFEQGATRCLRLGNAIGNTGDGPLQVDLAPEQGVLAPAGLGSFDQVIPLRSGGETRHPVGNADFHLTHMHFHYDGFARFSLYEWDEATGLRGGLAAEHKKSGFCFLDWGQMQEPDRAPSSGGRAEVYCIAPGWNGWSMGVSAGWFDFYWSSLPDQYIDAAGVPDGTYELVSAADWSDSLLETDESDNAASTILRITGDKVTVLEERSFYTMPEDTRNL